MTGRSVRQQDAGLIRRGVDDAYRALDSIQRFWGLWADDVRQEAEVRQGVAAGADLKKDPEFDRALDMPDAIRTTRLALQDVEACLTETEAMGAAAKSAEVEAGP